jgi:hypothetical protein
MQRHPTTTPPMETRLLLPLLLLLPITMAPVEEVRTMVWRSVSEW